MLKGAADKPAPVSTPASLEAVAAVEGTLENIYTRVNPSVVSIQVMQKAETSLPGLPGLPGFPFFFGPQGQQLPQQQAPQQQFRQGAGSGFIWDKEDHIIINNHVVEGADKIRVTFADGASAEAKIVGTDPDSDLAVLKVDVSADRMQPVELADSTQVKVGQSAVAIGNPFTLENTMTVGIISALGRQLPISAGTEQGLVQGPSYTIPDIIQTDAPINPGNSAAIVQKVVPSLIKTGSFEHPWLGLSGTSLNPDLAQVMNLKEDQRGALVIDVTPSSPADKANLHGSDRQVEIDGEPVRVGGDVVTAINDQPVHGFDDLVTYLASSAQAGQQVKLTVLRGGKEETVSATLAARPQVMAHDQRQGEVSSGVWLGIQGMTVTPEVAHS